MPVESPSPVLPFFFGFPETRLFGCYHEPRIGKARNWAVVICQPMGHEYIYCHRALRQLANRLCEAGFPVLRFDFHGCGDSSGDAEEGRLTRWQKDISSAIAEIKTRTSLAQVCLIGIRLGAALAFVAAAQRSDVNGLVLWDPVVAGRAYLEDLAQLQREALQRRRITMWNKFKCCNEVVGFPLPTALRAELQVLSLLTVAPYVETNILTIRSDQPEENSDFRHHLVRCGSRFEYRHVKAPTIWQPTVDGNLLVPNQVLQSIVAWTVKAQA